MKIALDVDGIFANFYLAMCQKYNMPYVTLHDWSVDWIDERFHLIQDDTEFWSNLPVFNPPEAITFDFECYMTHVPESQKQSRIDWLEKNGFPKKPVIVSGDKAETCVQMGIDVLVDDKPSTISECWRAGVVGIRYVPCYYHEPINSAHHVRHLSDVESIIKTEIAKRNVAKLAQ